MKSSASLFLLLCLLLQVAMAQDSFEDTEGSTKQSSGSCDRKCSGSISGLELVNERRIYTLAFAVRKGQMSLKSLLVTPLATITDLQQVTPTPSCEQSLACNVQLQYKAEHPNANRLRGFCGSKSLVGGNC